VSGAREEILRRVGAARSAAPTPAPVVRAYGGAGAPEGVPPVELLQRRLTDYKADVRRVGAGDVGRAVEEACGERGLRRLGVPPRLPASWRPRTVDLVEDHGMAPRELDTLDGVITGCTLAIAETGTLVLTAGPRDGRRALTLVPDVHICVVEAAQIVTTLPAAMPAIAGLVRAERRPATFISGPSATSDIELQRVEGVHGPRRLLVLIAGEPAG